MDNQVYSEFLAHEGIKYKSGRYEYGSGENPYQHDPHRLSKRAASLRESGMSIDDICNSLGMSKSQYIYSISKELKAKGKTETQIANELGITTTKLRANISIGDKEERLQKVETATKLKAKGMSNVAIGEKMGIPESSVRLLLDPSYKARAEALTATADALRDQMKTNKYLDIGKSSNIALGVSEDKLKKSVEILKEEGYEVMYLSVKQGGTGKNTSVKVLVPPGTDYQTLYSEQDKVGVIKGNYIDENKVSGKMVNRKINPPVSINSDRVMINYAEDGGVDKDGVIELRRGVNDLDLGSSRYAQVRIAVDGTHYLKGMAMYSDDLPDGVDIRFNTNKHVGTDKMDVLKPFKNDSENPYGATITRQNYYIDKNGNEVQGALNIVNEEGSWGKWSKNLASQMLSKQTTTLAKKQLDLQYEKMADEYNEIVNLDNAAIKQKLLQSFADNCDSASVHLKAAAMPRQASHVILPFTDISDNEIYAPNYNDGEKVVLIRYPHGGRFEIPELTVNNSNKQSAAKSIKNAVDAVGINSKVAERLSGADFDGDTVLVIPNNSGAIKTQKALEGLKNFDPKERYPAYEGMKRMTKEQKQQQMGRVSNLITDMTIKGATPDELAAAVRHSMVVIDAEKHNLNYKASEKDNHIAELKKKYQGSARAGASTLISKASSPQYVDDRKTRYNINKDTGEKEYIYTGKTTSSPIKNKAEEITGWTTKKVQNKSTKMAEAKDARALSSGTPMEEIYAQYANNVKSLANRARKELTNTPNMERDPLAAKKYKTEVESLEQKLKTADSNRPRERQAQILMNQKLKAYKETYPNADKDDIKKATNQFLKDARIATGANKEQIEITDSEWTAIQNGAISHTKLLSILDNADLDRVKELATPRTTKSMASADITRARNMLKNGYTQAQVAEALGVSTSTLKANNLV